MTNKEKQQRLQFLTDTDIKAKISSLIHSNSTIGALFVHPMLGIAFSLQLNKNFAVDIIGHIQGIMTNETSTNINQYYDLKRELEDRNNLIADFQRTSSECDKEITQLREQLMEKNREIRHLQQRNEELGYELDMRTKAGFFTRISLAGARIFSC